MAAGPAGVAMMPHSPQSGDASTPTHMQMQPVSPASPTMIMQQAANVNGEAGMQMMQPVLVAVSPAGVHAMPGMQAIPVSPPPGFMLKAVNQNAEQSPKDEND